MINNLSFLLGKTIKGIIVKKNIESGSPAVQIFIVFDDDMTYEIYSSTGMAFPDGLKPGGIEFARRYISPPYGPMEIILDTHLNDDGQIETPILK
jgi:hypothetical protein